MVVQSHLLQMRGLKPMRLTETFLLSVASFTDAWIETYLDRKEYWKENVASFTDAWIETNIKELNRLLKEVASFTDAWIETLQGNICLENTESHLLQMRGLKQIGHRIKRGSRRSHLLQMRGLKLHFSSNYTSPVSRIFYRCVD